MGSMEMMLLMEYGIPLAIKLLSKGNDEQATAEAVQNTIVALKNPDVVEALNKATPETKADIINRLASVFTGAENAVSGIVAALGGLFKKK